jgi:hypothetical protein
MKKRLYCLTLTLALAGFLGASNALDAGNSQEKARIAADGGPSFDSYQTGGTGTTDVVPMDQVSFNYSIMDDELNPLAGADVIFSQDGVTDTAVTDGGGFIALSPGAVQWGDMEVTIEHPATLRQTTTVRVPIRFTDFTFAYAVPTWREETISLAGDSLRSSNDLNVFMAGGGPPELFSFDYANLQSLEMVSAFVQGPVPQDAHAAIILQADLEGYLSLTIMVDTEAHYGTGVPATVTAIDEFGNPFPGIQVSPTAGIPGYPTAFSVNGTLPAGVPVVFLLQGVPIEAGTLDEESWEDEEWEMTEAEVLSPYPYSPDLILAAPCENLPADNTNPDEEICQQPFTFAPKAQLLGCVANCGGQSARKGKIGGKVTGQVGVKVGLEAEGGGGGASIGISASGEVSGHFEESYEIPVGKQRCWYLCSRETSWICYDWCYRWLGMPPKIEHVYAWGTDVQDSDCP